MMNTEIMLVVREIAWDIRIWHATCSSGRKKRPIFFCVFSHLNNFVMSCDDVMIVWWLCDVVLCGATSCHCKHCPLQPTPPTIGFKARVVAIPTHNDDMHNGSGNVRRCSKLVRVRFCHPEGRRISNGIARQILSCLSSSVVMQGHDCYNRVDNIPPYVVYLIYILCMISDQSVTLYLAYAWN
jgi:hypothetical protein